MRSSTSPGAEGLARLMKEVWPPCFVITTATWSESIISSNGTAEKTDTKPCWRRINSLITLFFEKLMLQKKISYDKISSSSCSSSPFTSLFGRKQAFHPTHEKSAWRTRFITRTDVTPRKKKKKKIIKYGEKKQTFGRTEAIVYRVQAKGRNLYAVYFPVKSCRMIVVRPTFVFEKWHSERWVKFSNCFCCHNFLPVA